MLDARLSSHLITHKRLAKLIDVLFLFLFLSLSLSLSLPLFLFLSLNVS
jgi:hypothetical protein